MAELEIRQPESNIYSNVEDCEALPLFVRYTSDDAKFYDKDATISFEDTVAQLSGTHVCYLIHRRQKGRNKVYEELAIKFDELPFCMTAQLARDECTLRAPHFTVKNMVLPEEKDQFIVRKCEVRFVDLYEDSFKLINGAGPYWVGHVQEITQFMKDCFSLPIPPIEIQIEEDKEMWQAYLDGLNALLENKRDLIKIQNISKQKGGLLKLDFDMDSYAQNLNNAITEELKSKCEMEASVSIDDGECLISFDSYQSIPEDTIESIKTIGRDYCYQADSEPTNTVSGKIAIISDSEELAGITSSIDSELTEFGVDLKKDESGEFLLTSDKDIEFLQKIVDTHHKGIAEVVCTTKLIMPLLPSAESVDINNYIKDLPDDTQVIPHGKHFVITSKRPLNTELSIFKKLRFASCMVSVSPKQIDTKIEIEGANIKGNTYTWIVNNPSELPRVGRYFNMVRKSYSDQYISSTFHYAFAPQIEKSVLADLKLQNYGKSSLQVDVPRSCVVFYPKSQEDYTTLKEDIFSQLDDSICAEAPEYEPTARIEFLCENEEYRRSIFEKVNVALADKRSNFTTNKLSKDAKELNFAFNFVDIEERDNIETRLEGALAPIHGIKILYDGNNNKGVTQWSLSEDLSLLQELDRKLQSDFRNENVNYINGSKYDKLSEVDEEELAHSQYSKESIIRRRQRQYLQKNSLNIGNCVRRTRDYAIIEPNDDIVELLSSKELKIVAGDYIQFPAMGETMELMRQSKAMSRILKPENKYNHRPINPNLPNYIFDPKYAGETVVDINTAMEDIRTHKIGNLNEKQLEAVTKSVLAKDLALIQGPPGTGKTTVIAEIIWQEIRKNPDVRILLTSQTNTAVDNALERLQSQAGIRPARILGRLDERKLLNLAPEALRFSTFTIDSWSQNSDKCTDNAARIWMDRIASKVSNDSKYSTAVASWKEELENKDIHSRSEFSRLYKMNVNLVAATCSICGSRDFMESYYNMFGGNESTDMYFDVVIMDEASKATPLEMAVPLVLGKKIIVIGDHKQLPPMMDENTIDSALEKIGKKEIAEKLQKAESQFKRLFEAAAKVRKTIVATLDTQYRMHEQIMNTIKQFYQEELAATGGLKCGITETMDIPDLGNKGSRWHGITLNPIIQPSTHAVWIDVHTPETYLNPGYKNEGELKAIDLVLKALQQADGYSEFIDAQQKTEDKEIGIITFYSGQNREIKKNYDYRINKKIKRGEYICDVVDRFQGMERNIVVVSTVRSNKKPGGIGFAKDIERINVAFSRAKRLLIVVGNKRQFESNSNYAASIANMETVSFEQLKDAIR